jgi:hypothetical protein
MSKRTHELSLVEKDILACYEQGQPVLLYGNDGLDLEELIERIKIAYIEIQIEQNPSSEEFYKSSINLPFSLIKYINCGGMDGREVYEALVVHSGLHPLEEGYLLIEHGNLIISNLHCDTKNVEDDKYYRKLGKIIEDRHIGHSPTSFNWLVAYTNDPDPFPLYFKDQFEPISLSNEGMQQKSDFEEKKIKGFGAFRKNQQLVRWSINKARLEVYYYYENIKYPIKLTALQFSVFCCLHKKIGSYVKITTLAKCWEGKEPNYTDYVQDCISKIKNQIKQELNKHTIKDYGNIIEPDKPKNTKAYKLLV